MKKLIKKIWSGNLELGKTFWLVNILGTVVVSIPLFLGDIYYSSLNEFFSLVVLIFIPIFIAYFIFATVGTWRSATIYITLKKKKKQSTIWGYSAKVVLALGILRSIGKTLTWLFTL